MNTLDEKIDVNVHRFLLDGTVRSSIRCEMNPTTRDLICRSYLNSVNPCFSFPKDDKLRLNYQRFKFDEGVVTCIKPEENACPTALSSEPTNLKPALNIPTMIRCQNCETNFPTKYQYQRHQCEFNAEKIVLKSDADLRDDGEKGVRVKFACDICEKQFVSKNNLERHRVSHETAKDNICEHCSKQFVSENRLRIHKENHCKKAGDISKFYRSDVTVWKCKKCHEVFSSTSTANYHVAICTEMVLLEDEKPEIKNAIENDADLGFLKDAAIAGCNGENVEKFAAEDKNIEKMLTEILLQCEFCNRTYAEKRLLLMHQKKHTTSRNYECANCAQAFDSYAVASQHWMKKCSEFVSLFYLPKLTYCEFCDRTFKSHELLYTHKVKKKHYTPKMHAACVVEEEEKCEVGSAKAADNKEILNKLIEDVLKTLHVPVNNKNADSVDLSADRSLNALNDDNKENEDVNDLLNADQIKIEASDLPSIEICQEVEEVVAEKKKRGRKRKWPKNQSMKLKKFSSEVDEGFKYQCERCIKVFVSIASLETHRDKEHAASFTCEECGQILHSAKALLIHSRAHKSLKPYVCETCGRSYSQTSHLWQHMRFHQGIKPFACPHEGCEARYTIRPDLKDHIRKVHTRERPFKCTVCDKCFLTGSVYYQHRLIHTNDRRYGCDLCPKRFFRADALNNHRRIHTDERPYPCKVCGREFRQKGDRNKHVRTQHPDVDII